MPEPMRTAFVQRGAGIGETTDGNDRPIRVDGSETGLGEKQSEKRTADGNANAENSGAVVFLGVIACQVAPDRAEDDRGLE